VGLHGRQHGRESRCHGAKGEGLRALPEPGGHILHAAGLRQALDAGTAQVQLAVLDQGDGRFKHRQPPAERGLGHLAWLAAALALASQQVHIGQCIAALAVRGAGVGTQQAAAHVSVQRGARNAQALGGLGGGEVAGHGWIKKAG